MKKRTSRCNSDTFKLAITNQMQGTESRTDKNNVDNSDISLLQRPLTTAYSGFEEARRAYEDGTNEVRRLLSQECSLIYECNVCRNMFRSVANFISHKRVFCCVSARSANQNGYTDQNSTMIIQSGNGPSAQDIEHMLRSRSTGCSPVPREVRPMRGGIRDLSGVIERLRREKANTAMRQSPTVLHLEPVPTSSQAVYQTIKIDHDDSIKTEVNEVHHMLNPADTIVGPDGKAISSNSTHKIERRSGSDSGETGEQSISDDAETSILCEICNLTFQTHKTLELHIQKHHSSSAFVFQCPACSLTFMQAAAVIRHLSKDHKKPTRRIRMMRNTILKRRVQQGDIQPKGPSRELKRLQLSDDVVGYVPPEQTNNGGEQRKIMSLCIYCEKSFERRAALSTHLLNCRAKQEALAKPAPNVKGLKLKHNSSNPSSLDASGEDLANINANATNIGEINDKSLDQTGESDTNALNEMFADLADRESEPYAAGLQTVSLDKLQLQNESDSASDESSNSDDDDRGPDPEPLVADERNIKVKGKKKRTVPIEKQMRCRCKICNKQFNALGNLRRHISMFHYRARRFGCTLCDYRAFRRYDIINHLGFTHKIDGDREMLTEKYVSTHECEYSRDDVDADIVLLDDEDKVPPTENKTGSKATEKRVRRSKPVPEPGPIPESVVIKEEPDSEPTEPTPNKRRRKSRSQISPESGEQTAEKRPIRRRVKAVNKDFVYDMISFKADGTGGQQQQPVAGAPVVDSMRAKLRRQPGTEESKPKQWEAFITEENKALVQGITRRVMLELVSQGRAVSATLPELPAERPQIRPRLTSYTRNESSQQSNPNVVDTGTSSEPESFIEKIAKRRAAAGKDTAVISNLWNKVNTAIAHQQQQQKHESEKSKEKAETQLSPNGKQSPLHTSSSMPVTVPLPKPEPVPEPELEPSQAPAQLSTTPPPPPLPPQSSSLLGIGNRECLSSTTNITEATGPPTMFPALPKPPSVLQATASGTIQFTLDSLLRAALQN